MSLLLGIRGADNSYMHSKLLALVLVVPACLLGGLYLLRDEHARKLWVSANVVYGAIVLLVAVTDPEINSSNQLVSAGGNALGSGRAAGAMLTVLGVFFFFQKRHRLLLLSGMALGAYGIATAAERGPALAAIVAVVVTAALAPGRGKSARVLLITAALVGMGTWLTSGGLVGKHLTASGDVSSQTRLRLWRDSWHLAWSHPFGVGWGGLYDALPTPDLLPSGFVQYPHNLPLEVASEAGLLTAVVVLVLAAVAFHAQRSRATTPTEVAMLALFLFFAVNSLVSSDFTGNRGVWISFGAAFAVTPPVGIRKRQSGLRPPARPNTAPIAVRASSPPADSATLGTTPSVRGHRGLDGGVDAVQAHGSASA